MYALQKARQIDLKGTETPLRSIDFNTSLENDSLIFWVNRNFHFYKKYEYSWHFWDNGIYF
jgi:hypothetical protein